MTAKKQTPEKPALAKSRFSRHKIRLVFGVWKILFKPEKLKLLIAEALNEWTFWHQHSLRLNGYLIKDDVVYLILKTEKGRIHQLLALFYQIVVSKIEHHHTTKIEFDEDHQFMIPKMLWQKPFVKHLFLDEVLIKLLIGEPVDSVYENLALNRLKETLNHYTYCSVIDYEGGCSPVNVSLFNDETEPQEIISRAIDPENEYLF